MTRTAVLVASIALGFTGITSAQTSKEGVISTTTEIVTVPVVVNDSSGKPVRGLKQDDFQIRENGKEQHIASFEEVTATRLTIRGNAEQNGIYTNRVSNDSPLAVGILVIDFVNTPSISQAWALRGALAFLDKWKGDGGFKQPIMVAAITNQGLRIIHQATSDPEVLEAALKMLSPTPPAVISDSSANIPAPSAPPRGPDNQVSVVQRRNESDDAYRNRVKEATTEADIFNQINRQNEVVRGAGIDANTQTTMWALTAIANGVAGIPGRKALIWCSEGFPFRQVAAGFETPQWVAAHGSTDENPELALLRTATLLAFNRANISVYPINAAGLLSRDILEASATNKSIMTGQTWAGKVMHANDVDQDNRAYAQIVASKTSGMACMASNDIAGCIGDALDDASHYYMLAYYPDPKPKGVGYHKIKVEVKGTKLSVRARDSYWYGALPANSVSAKSDVAVALGSNLDYTALPIVFRFTGMKPAPENGKRLVEFMIGVDGRIMSIDEDHDNHISLLIGAQAKAGDHPTIISIDTKLKPELVPQIRAKQLTHKGEMELGPGKYEVRVVVRDNLTGNIGSVVAPIDIPQ